MARLTSPLRWRPRPRGAGLSIRAKILALLLLPVVPLLAMWMLTIGATLGPARGVYTSVTDLQSVGEPSAAVVDQLQAERRLSMAWAGERHDPTTKSALAAQRAATDRAVATLDRDTAGQSFRDAESSLTRAYLGVLSSALGSLPKQRAAIDRAATQDDVMTFYDTAIDDAFGLYGSIAGIDDHDIARQASTVVGLMQAREMFAREDAVVTGAAAAGKLTANAYPQLVGAIGAERYLYQQATRFLPSADQRSYQSTLSSAAFTRLRGLEDQLSGRTATKTGLPSGFDVTAWERDFTTVNGALKSLEATEAQRAIAATRPTGERIVVRLAIAGGIGLLMLLVLIIISVRIGRGIIARVHGLRTEALALARDRLPSIVARLRRGEMVDVASESPPLAYGTDELGQLADALSRAQRTAIAAAVQEAELRDGLNDVFLNIARRNQTLLHRQLALLDEMERRVTDPDDLAELFRIDHLATRMRRHAEDLVILAGATPGRGWRHPVAFADILRAAAAEVELYTRISVRRLPDLALAGRAVGDTVHLIAELLENATAFSPPETQVTVAVQRVPHGCAIEIEDRGVGMTPDALAAANARLATPSDFHPSQSSRLGLFVVARLASRHGIGVTLRASPFGGVTAVVLLPPELVVTEPEPPSLPTAQPFAATRMLTSVHTGNAVIDGTATVDADAEGVDAITVVETDGADTDECTIDHDGATGAADVPEIPAGDDGDAPTPEDAVVGDESGPTVVPRQRTLTLVTPEPGTSTTRGVTPDGLPQRVRPSGRTGRTIRLVTETVPPEPADGTGELEDVRTDGDATPLEAPRTPERMRTMLTSFQDGMTLGRRRAQASFAAVPADEPAPRDVAARSDRPDQKGDPGADGDAHAIGDPRPVPEDADGTADHAESDTAGSERGMLDR